MKARTWRAAIFAALLFLSKAVMAQDVTLTAREGGLEISGTLLGYDGSFFRVDTAYGQLTVDGEGVICDGPGCPDLTAPRATIRIVGAPDAGEALLPRLFAAFAATRGLAYRRGEGPDYSAEISDPLTGRPLADIIFSPMTGTEARAALVSGQAELMLAAMTEPGLGAQVVAFDALIPIVARDNPVPQISSPDLARALSGEIANWAEIGGPDMPLVLHALIPAAEVQRALAGRLGRAVTATVTHPDLASLAAAVARDPWALAVTGQTAKGSARALTLTDSCGFALPPTALAVKAGDYPLSLPFYLMSPPRRLPLVAREFLEFLALPPGQAAVAAAGYVNRTPERHPMTADGMRLINAIQGAGSQTTLDDLKRLVDLMAGADRLSLTFRFEDGSNLLDGASTDNLTDLARLLEIGKFRGETVVLAGFSDGSGSAPANLELSRDRAAVVLAALQKIAPGLAVDRMPVVVAFGEALPMACDSTVPGRRLNRRVEVWLTPGFVTDSLVP